MKKTIITLMLTFAAIVSIAQTKAKPDTSKSKVIYQRFVSVDPVDYNNLIGIANHYRTLVTYSPVLKPEEKIQEQANIDGYLADLAKRFKLDSVKVITPKTK